MFVELNAKAMIDGKVVEGFASVYFNTHYVEGVIESFNDEFVKVIPIKSDPFLVTKDDWLLLKKKIEAAQRKQLR